MVRLLRWNVRRWQVNSAKTCRVSWVLIKLGLKEIQYHVVLIMLMYVQLHPPTQTDRQTDRLPRAVTVRHWLKINIVLVLMFASLSQGTPTPKTVIKLRVLGSFLTKYAALRGRKISSHLYYETFVVVFSECFVTEEVIQRHMTSKTDRNCEVFGRTVLWFLLSVQLKPLIWRG